jgi:hypothetical protein
MSTDVSTEGYKLWLSMPLIEDLVPTVGRPQRNPVRPFRTGNFDAAFGYSH